MWSHTSLEPKPLEGYKYIAIDDDGVPFIIPTNMKVVELIMEKEAYKWNPDQLQVQHPYLSLAQIHCALYYYYDHKQGIDADIECRIEFVREMRKKMAQSPLSEKLKARKHV